MIAVLRRPFAALARAIWAPLNRLSDLDIRIPGDDWADWLIAEQAEHDAAKTLTERVDERMRAVAAEREAHADQACALTKETSC